MFSLNEEQKMFQESIRQFAKDVVEPRAAEIDEKGEFPWDMVEKLKENGFMGLPFPEEYGGEGADLAREPAPEPPARLEPLDHGSHEVVERVQPVLRKG